MAYGTNAPFGFRPVRYLNGTAWTGATNPYPIASAYSTSLFQGDPLIPLADGTIGIGTAGNPGVGIFWGVKYRDSAGNYQFSKYWPASTVTFNSETAEAQVIDDPFLLFSAQEAATSSTAGTALALADRNLNINFKSGTGSTLTGQSAYFLDNATEATTSSLNFKIYGLDPTPGNVVGSYANWLVTWNNHVYKGGAGTTGY
jgi:hypothetical protein